MTGDNFGLAAGNNIALKIPAHLFEATLWFYRDIVKLKPAGNDRCFHFGDASRQQTLWLDKVDGAARSDVWLELRTSDLEGARAFFTSQGITIADSLEPLPPGYKGFWIIDPAGIVHLVSLYGE